MSGCKSGILKIHSLSPRTQKKAPAILLECATPTQKHFTESALFVNKHLYYLPEISSELKKLLPAALSSAKTNAVHAKYLAPGDDDGETGSQHTCSFHSPETLIILWGAPGH